MLVALDKDERVAQLHTDEQVSEEHDDVHVLNDDMAASVNRSTFELELEGTMFDLQ